MPDTGVEWVTRWEGDLAHEEHDALSAMISLTFERIDPGSSAHFRDGRSWAGERPEIRLYARNQKGVRAHISVKRRFVRVSGRDQLVGDIGMVAVHPEAQRTGLGTETLRKLDDLLHVLSVPFGLVDCRHEIVNFYASNGWSLLPDSEIRCADNADPRTTLTVAGPVLIRPVTEHLKEWPSGKIIERNGFEV
ncbi:hypothetical protein L3Q65_24420 [Amycolatopsis sp. FU40]|uniref:GNAT family N-acetyltransferase n=1 Tax=Amycolatopsis sp. FU40 TaxID=2914159 RepID=UPI001F24E3C5|nr:GNAT family N-acetyltransferase [Amycolatopsis sp. FU40]UKD51076.1 hypothetical protein L3Q65_24420 [Amycolatopsis sp. FU40]